eukprot:352584-Pleurochrysis_carterae.AAC.1
MRCVHPAAARAGFFAAMSKRNAPAQNESLQEGNANYVRTDDFGALYQAMQPWMREMVARRWMKEHKLYWGELQSVASPLEEPTAAVDRSRVCSRWRYQRRRGLCSLRITSASTSRRSLSRLASATASTRRAARSSGSIRRRSRRTISGRQVRSIRVFALAHARGWGGLVCVREHEGRSDKQGWSASCLHSYPSADRGGVRAKPWPFGACRDVQQLHVQRPGRLGFAAWIPVRRWGAGGFPTTRSSESASQCWPQAVHYDAGSPSAGVSRRRSGRQGGITSSVPRLVTSTPPDLRSTSSVCHVGHHRRRTSCWSEHEQLVIPQPPASPPPSPPPLPSPVAEQPSSSSDGTTPNTDATDGGVTVGAQSGLMWNTITLKQYVPAGSNELPTKGFRATSAPADEVSMSERKRMSAMLQAACKKSATLQRENAALASQQRRDERLHRTAQELGAKAVAWKKEADDSAAAVAQLKGQRTARERAEQKLRAGEDAQREQQSELARLREELKGVSAQLASSRAEHLRDAARLHADSARDLNRDLAALRTLCKAYEVEVAALKNSSEELRKQKVEAEGEAEVALQQVAEMAAAHQEDVSRHVEEVAALAGKLAAAQEAMREAGVGAKVGRPKGFAGREALEDRWDVMSGAARRQALWSHTNSITVALMSVGCAD